MIDQALFNLCPQTQWSVKLNGSYEDIEWLDDGFKPSKEQVQAEIVRLQTEFDSKEYARNRAAEYPSIGDQLDALFHAGVFPPEMAAKIQAVKDKYPKV